MAPIHPLWLICILSRLCLAYYYFKNAQKIGFFSKLLLLIIGIGFGYKSITGSNNEYQIRKVFWHSSRKYHAMFYLVSFCFTLFLTTHSYIYIPLCLDVIYSLAFRFFNCLTRQDKTRQFIL